MAECVFCQIAEGKIPALKIYENEDLLAFLDISPLSDGHTLVIPKKHFERLDELPEDLACKIARILPKLSKAIVKATGAKGYNILQNNGKVAGQQVMHVHFHIIPRDEADGLGYRWLAKKYPEGKDKAIQEKILSALKD